MTQEKRFGGPNNQAVGRLPDDSRRSLPSIEEGLGAIDQIRGKGEPAADGENVNHEQPSFSKSSFHPSQCKSNNKTTMREPLPTCRWQNPSFRNPQANKTVYHGLTLSV